MPPSADGALLAAGAATAASLPECSTSGTYLREVTSRDGSVWRLRSIRQPDALTVAALQAASFHERSSIPFIDGFSFKFFQAEVLDALRKKMATIDDDSFVMLVAEDSNGRTVGIIEVARMQDPAVARCLVPSAPNGQYAYISSMAVSPEVRRKGVATALLSGAEDVGRFWSLPLALHVYEANSTAIACYTACGYSQAMKDAGWIAVFGAKVKVLMSKTVM